MKVSRARGWCGGGFPGSDRSRKVLARAQIDSWGPVSGPTAGIGADFGHAAALPSAAARSARGSAGVRLRRGRGHRERSAGSGAEACRAAVARSEGLESRAPVAAATPEYLFGALACQSATIWR